MIKINFETFNLNNLIYTYLSRRVGMGAYSLVVPDLNNTVVFVNMIKARFVVISTQKTFSLQYIAQVS